MFHLILFLALFAYPTSSRQVAPHHRTGDAIPAQQFQGVCDAYGSTIAPNGDCLPPAKLGGQF